MAAKQFKAAAASQTRSSRSKMVSKRIASAMRNPARTNVARLKATNAAIRAANQSRVQIRSRNPVPNHSPYYGMYAALRRQQHRAIVSGQARYAKGRTSQQLLQLSRSSFARQQAINRAMIARARTSYALGAVKGMGFWTTQAAGATPLPKAIASVTANPRNTSAAARLAQSAKARKGNSLRRGRTFKKSGGGSAVTSAPRIAPARISRRRKRTGMLPPKAVATPRAGVLRTCAGETPWAVAGNDRGLGNCAAVAVANSLWYHESLMMSDAQIDELAASASTIPRMLRYMKCSEMISGAWPEGWCNPVVCGPGDLVVYETENGTHASLLLSGAMVVSYGEEVLLKYPLTEGWHIRWRTSRQSGQL